MNLLIDGYNLIPAIPELRRLLHQDLEAGREGLIKLLQAYKKSAPDTHSIMVIFDGKGGAGAPEREKKTGGIAVRFSRGEIADNLILRLLRKEKRGAVLVTSDRALGEAAAEHASAVIRTGEFTDRLLQAQFMDEEDRGGEEGPSPRQRLSTKKKGNPRKLSKKDRQKQRTLKKL